MTNNGLSQEQRVVQEFLRQALSFGENPPALSDREMELLITTPPLLGHHLADGMQVTGAFGSQARFEILCDELSELLDEYPEYFAALKALLQTIEAGQAK